MAKEIKNEIAFKGKVLDVSVRKQGEGQRGPWTLYEVRLGNIPNAGKRKDDAGFITYSAFNDAPKEGQVIGQVCRVTGFEYNKDGQVAYGSSLSAVGKAKVFEDAPVAEEAADSDEDDGNWGWKD